jgi:hypothetical protein
MQVSAHLRYAQNNFDHTQGAKEKNAYDDKIINPRHTLNLLLNWGIWMKYREGTGKLFKT